MQAKLRLISTQFEELCRLEEQRTQLESELQNTQKLYHRASYKGYPSYQLQSYQISYDAMRNDFDETTLRYRNKLVILLKQAMHMLFTSMADRANSEQRCVDLGYRLLESFDAEPRHVVQSSIYQSLPYYTPLVGPTSINKYHVQKQQQQQCQHDTSNYRLDHPESNNTSIRKSPTVEISNSEKCCERCHAAGHQQEEQQQEQKRLKSQIQVPEEGKNPENKDKIKQSFEIPTSNNATAISARRMNLSPGAARFARLSRRLSTEFGLDDSTLPDRVEQSDENSNRATSPRFRGHLLAAVTTTTTSKPTWNDEITTHHGNLDFTKKHYELSSSPIRRPYSNASMNPFAIT
jgi:hypothetical protein